MLGTAEAMTEERAPLTEASRPVLPRYARLHFDKVRGRHVLLVPERVLVPDETAIEILQLCDGKRTIGDIVDVLAAKYAAERELIGGDVIAMLEDLRGRDFLVVVEGD
jgi:pyrroloquinoline quinone biosynthesis protein D